MSTSIGGVDVPLKLPRQRLRGNQLLGKYKGSAEALSLLFGAQVHHLRNDDLVQMDFVTATFGISVLVAGQWATLLPREEEAETGDTGSTWGWTSSPTDTGTPTDTGIPWPTTTTTYPSSPSPTGDTGT